MNKICDIFWKIMRLNLNVKKKLNLFELEFLDYSTGHDLTRSNLKYK